MKAHLSDARELYIGQPLGSSEKWSLNKRGVLTIPKTDLAYRLTLTFTPLEMEILRDRLDEILTGRPPGSSIIMKEAESLLKKSRKERE